MPKINKNSLAKRFGKSKNSYENATPIQEKMAQFLITKIAKRLEKKEVFSILEIGCGTGRLTRKLISQFPKAEIIAIDISKEMLAKASKATKQPVYVNADAEEFIHSLSNKFDLIVSNAAIQWFEKPEIALPKLYTLLKPQGFLALATFANKTFFELSSAFDDAYIFNALEKRQHVVVLPSIKAWQEMLPLAEIVDEIIEKKFPDVRSFLRSIQQAGAVNSTNKINAIPKKVLKSMYEFYNKNHSLKTGEICATYHSCYIFCDAL